MNEENILDQIPNNWADDIEKSILDDSIAVLPLDPILAEICKKCAECCKNYPFVDLSTDEIHSLELLTGVNSDVFAIQKRKAIEGYFLQFQDNGNCFFLGEKNGDLSCSVYEARPEICREYPSKPLQKNTCNAHKKKFAK